MLCLRHFFVCFDNSQSIDNRGICEDSVENTKRAHCSQFMKHYPNVLLECQGFCHSNTSPLDREDSEVATEFVCGFPCFALMTGYFLYFPHPITVLTIISLNPCLDEDTTNAFPSPFEVLDEIKAFSLQTKGVESKDVELNLTKVACDSPAGFISICGGEQGMTIHMLQKCVSKGV